jgi:hypothetical protein
VAAAVNAQTMQGLQPQFPSTTSFRSFSAPYAQETVEQQLRFTQSLSDSYYNPISTDFPPDWPTSAMQIPQGPSFVPPFPIAATNVYQSGITHTITPSYGQEMTQSPLDYQSTANQAQDMSYPQNPAGPFHRGLNQGSRSNTKPPSPPGRRVLVIMKKKFDRVSNYAHSMFR